MKELQIDWYDHVQIESTNNNHLFNNTDQINNINSY